MNATRVLVANDLRSYREAVALALREMRPGVEVFEAEAEELDREVRRLLPDIVVCSQLTELVENRIPYWVELYPYCESRAVVGIRGKRSALEDIQLSDILSLVDRIDSLAHLD